MPLVINTNVTALNAQRQLVRSGNELNQAMERLSSGKRINTAADDAAGLAISNRMTSQVMGLTQAIRNANDGISMIQTAEGAMDESTNILQRIRELAIQASNGIYSEADRKTLDAEVQQLKQELDRIATSTTFNGQLLLDGSLGDVNLQVGAQAGQTISMKIPAMDIRNLGGANAGDIIGMRMNAPPTGISIDNTGDNRMFINKQNVGNLSDANSMKDLLDMFNKNVSGVTTTAFTEVVAGAAGTGILRGGATMTLTLHQIDNSVNTYEITDTGSMEELANKITAITGGAIKGSLTDDGKLIMSNEHGAAISVTYDDNEAALAATGVEATVDGDGDESTEIEFARQAQLSFTSNDGKGITVRYGDDVTAGSIRQVGLNARDPQGDISGLVNTSQNALKEGDLILNGISIGAVSNTTTGAAAHAVKLRDAINALSHEHGIVASVGAGDILELNSISGKEITVEYGSAAASTIGADTGLFETNISSTRGNAVADISIDTVDGAQKALGVVDRALETINSTRADLGAVANRLEFTMSNLENVVEKTSASRSRIMDADFAAETAALSRAQVLQQASQAMLAQANAQPQQVLQLLQG